MIYPSTVIITPRLCGILDSTHYVSELYIFFRLNSTFWLDSTHKLNYDTGWCVQSALPVAKHATTTTTVNHCVQNVTTNTASAVTEKPARVCQPFSVINVLQSFVFLSISCSIAIGYSTSCDQGCSPKKSGERLKLNGIT